MRFFFYKNSFNEQQISKWGIFQNWYVEKLELEERGESIAALENVKSAANANLLEK